MRWLAAAADETAKAAEKSEGSNWAFLWATLVVLGLLVVLHFLVRNEQKKIDGKNADAAADDVQDKTVEATAARKNAAGADEANKQPAEEQAEQAQATARLAAENLPAERPTGRKGLLALVVGQDNRVSTSKLQVFLWTISIVWAMWVVFFWVSGSGAAIQASFEQAFDIQGEYLILLGFPATAGIVAKALTSSRVASGEMDKPPAPELKAGTAVTNDEGDADLGDWQYFLFNIVAVLAVFYRLFVGDPGDGLPAIPDTLVALTGASAAIYTGKKAAERQAAPIIKWVQPETLDLTKEATIKIGGTGFVASGDKLPDPANKALNAKWWVSLGGFPVEVTHWEDTLVEAKLEPDDLTTIADRSNADVIVYNTAGVASPAQSVNLVQPPSA